MKVQRSNYLPYLQHYLDDQSDPEEVILDVVCAICQESKLDISKSAREFASSEAPPIKHLERFGHLPHYGRHGLERTVALACGHVFGERCIGGLLAQAQDLICPSCGYKMAYRGCGHAIPPALIPVDGHEPVRDKFPLTMAEEGGSEPQNCAECRWKLIRSNIRYSLADECVACRHRPDLRNAADGTGHRAHRDLHMKFGLRQALDDTLRLVWPEVVTRETEWSAEMTAADTDRRQVHASLLNAMVLSEIDATIWYRTKAGSKGSSGTTLTKEQQKTHAQGVAAIEQSLLGWLVNSSPAFRRMW
ncbi:uncharacterized protein GGS25DRAFT_109341 [Hypoxylon fragiforme]|uniref:uncharacterized protein n=1 Tax=Hypoxylon fragiforme TaxID=63214 RepID=UPI0020C6E3F1|nr:uncharacterized protein GGS25DRAFT_109341 [Hypoxylon fragiforme]KAI2612178.1 hypothetical protein GGS25DRAFT_109341 [Hypoxylon fragiforme]